MSISLVQFSDDMYFDYFLEYENDMELFLDKSKYKEYIYSEKNVTNYIQNLKDKNRVSLAICMDSIIIGEIVFKNIKVNESVELGICLKNKNFKNKGYGTFAIKEALKYAKEKFCVKKVIADVIVTNKRSQHVLKKVGFKKIGCDSNFIYFSYEEKVK